MKAVSLFSGIGGLDLGFKSVFGEEGKVRDYVEKETFRQSVILDQLINSHSLLYQDIENYHPTEDWEFEDGVVFGGFPCKGTSQAGKKNAFENPQSKLWFQMLRVVKEVKPAYVVIENPTGLLHNGLKEVLNGLRSAKYHHGMPQIVSASEIGSPHKRERVFIVAYSDRLVQTRGGKLPAPWSNSIRCHIEAVRERKGVSDQSPIHRISDGVSPRPHKDHWIKSINRFGWWSNNFCPNWFVKKREEKDRFSRVAALGDACTPQQAEVAFLRLKEIKNFYDLAKY